MGHTLIEKIIMRNTGASDAGVVDLLTEGISFVVHLIGSQSKCFSRTGYDAESAPLAPVGVDDQGSFDFAHCCKLFYRCCKCALGWCGTI